MYKRQVYGSVPVCHPLQKLIILLRLIRIKNGILPPKNPYGRLNTVCYVYPRILAKGNTYDLIDSNDFPKAGRIEVRIQGGDSSEDVFLRFGSLVSIRINREALSLIHI